MSVEDRVITIVAHCTGRARCDVSKKNRLKDDLGLDSMGLIELSTWLEDSFGIHIKDDDMRWKMNTVQDTICLVQSRVLACVT